jgi:hypothetical protein
MCDHSAGLPFTRHTQPLIPGDWGLEKRPLRLSCNCTCEVLLFPTAAVCYHSSMFFKRQPKSEQDEQPIEESGPAPFLPPVQVPNQSDDDYRLVLINQIAEIDKTKRDIKGQIHSNAIRAKAERASVDQVWLRRAKDKIDHLTREREEIRKVLHTVNERIKEQRRAANKPQTKMTIQQAFMQVAKERLPLDLYDSLMNEAAERMQG